MKYYIFIAFILTPLTILAQEVQDVAKEAQNPLANVISMPFQNNTDFGIGDYNKTGNTLNIQPIIPVSLGKSKRWLLINRIIVPFPKTVPDVNNEHGSGTTGLGDITYTAWFAPPTSGNLTWGFGVVTILPTASEKGLGQEKFSIGPSLVFVYSNPKYMAAAIVSDWKSVGGSESVANVHTFYFQYIFTYFLQNKWYASTAPINLANWEGESGQQWTVPIGGGFGKMFSLGKMPLDFQTQAFYNVVRPDNGPEWQLRVQLKLLFPKG